MKIKRKQLIFFVIVVILSVVPITIFLFKQHENQRIDSIIKRTIVESSILSRASLNVLLINGGDIENTSLDLKEMISTISSLREEGLVYADIVLLSSKPEYNGIILANIEAESSFNKKYYSTGKLAPEEVIRLVSQENLTEKFIEHFNDHCYEFVAKASLPDRPPLCFARMIFSKSLILKPVNRTRKITFTAVIVAITILGVLGFFIVRMLTHSIDDLIRGVERLGSGDMDFEIKVESKDEFSRLGTTINHFVKIIKLQIQELQRTNQELVKLDQLKDDFLATVSHELRTPLYGIIGITETMLDSIAEKRNKKGLNDLNLIMVSAKRLSQLINNILDYSRLRHGDIELVIEQIDINAVIQVVISILKPLINNKGLQIYNNISTENNFVLGDASRLQQIMLNIIGNAVKFSSEGSISLSSSYFTDESGKSMVSISISDTGIGIPEGKNEEIFDLFVQGDNSITRSYDGAGLGLAISKHLVELHGGTIKAETVHTGGARFTITLKRAIDESGDLKKQDALFEDMGDGYYVEVESLKDEYKKPEVKNVKDKKSAGLVMVIDDEPVNLHILRRSLEQWGYEVKTAMYGYEALEMIDKGIVPDLIILDVMLPQMSGYDVCRAIRKKFPLHELPVLMVTAKGKPEDIEAGFESGANDYISKPVERKELHARVQSLISLGNTIKLAGELSLIQHDLDVAHDIQKTVLLQDVPQIAGVNIVTRYMPMDQLGGDFYDVQQIDEDRIAVLIADVSGHGLPAAFICAMLKVAYTFHLDQENEPHKLMGRINETMFTLTGEMFITAFFALIDLKNKKISQSSAGQWPLIACNEDISDVRFIKSKGIPFGWLKESNHTTDVLDFKSGDRLIFYTDGIIEVRNKEGKMFWIENLIDFIKDKRQLPIDNFADELIDHLKDWSGKDTFNDDVTFILIDV